MTQQGGCGLSTNQVGREALGNLFQIWVAWCISLDGVTLHDAQAKLELG